MTLEVKNLTKNFNHFTAVKNFNFKVNKGQMLGFLGRNGAGKTTTFRMLLGLTKQSEGSITYNNKKIDKTIYNFIGYLPEERGLHPKRKVKEEVKFLAKIKGMNNTEIEKELDYWFEKLNISKYKNKKIETLSKGNQQKVQFLTSIIHRPDLLILDEPFSGLDPVNVENLKQVVKELNEQGTTIIFSSHRMDHVEELCDEICLIDKGEIILNDSIKDIKNHSHNKRVLVESDQDLTYLKDIEGILNFEVTKNAQIFFVKDDNIARILFENISKLDFVKKFEVLEPSLNDIFIEKVGENFE
ncbi:ATP-binding cassette domain-containing protein [Staphylococcus saprophyticus]|uniref:ABC transporter ATP-binding protein n=1 Tax=Staphylococcus saprophyticus TaxID=29385 RepID=UPI000E68A66B|nr:ABC transporter ATP-binding protein [Staphylococcus saprophyticus]RIO31285.1 ATP-binding cassette domain-containing protein [Staphylococcus saprophyticus]